MNTITAKPAPYFGPKPVTQFSFLGYGQLPEIDAHVASPVSVGDPSQVSSIAADLGCRAFDSSGRLFVRVDKSCLTREPSDASTPAVYGLEDTPPWHCVDVFFDIPSRVFASFEMRVEFLHDVPRDVNWYLCFFGGHHPAFYGGLQTSVGCPENVDRQGSVVQPCVQPDYGCIFSRWGPATVEDARVCGPSFCEAGVYEGDFVSVRRHVHWKKGQYRLKLELDDTQDEGGVWIRYTVKDLASGEEHNVGALRFRNPPRPLTLGKSMYQFAEIYGAEQVFSNQITSFSYIVSHMCLNGEVIAPKCSSVYYKQSPGYVRVHRAHDRDDWHLLYEVGPSKGPRQHLREQIHQE